MITQVERECTTINGKNAFVFILGGEHTITLGALQALALRRSASKTTVCQIDAHLDLHDTDADYRSDSYGKYAHSTVMRRACDLGYKCVMIGARAYTQEEMVFARKNGLTVFEWKGQQAPKPSAIVSAIKTNSVYVTFDVDGVDPAHMPATGTPVQGGLAWYYALELLSEIFKKKRVVGADIVEVAPRPYEVATEYGAAQLCYTMIGFLNTSEKSSIIT
jgi:agmatinase